MKTLKMLLLAFSIFSVIPAIAQKAKVKNTKQTALIKRLVDTHRFVFWAQYVSSLDGTQRYLTSEYNVKISKDTLDSYLPYFGRAYSAPIDPTKSALIFQSYSFDYELKNRKKGGWDISVHLKDNSDVRVLYFNIYDDGTANLQVTSNNRQSISFTGYIAEIKDKTKK